MATVTSGSEDVTNINGQKQVNDIMKRVLFEDIDQDGSYFSYLFMEKIFGDNRTCQFCGAYGSGCVPNGSHSPEVYVTEEGIVGKQVVECVRCKKQETVLSHDDLAIPNDHRLRIHGREVRYYCKNVTHFEVLHDLLELLHVAAIEDVKQKKEKHAEVASFMMQKAKRVCEEWCKSEYAELRYKKYLRLRHETLIDSDYSPVFPPDASEDYKEMYHMMATSFRSNREKVVRLLKLMKESLFDNPSRPSFMHWVSIAMMHSEQYQDFKSQYDLHTYNSVETTDLKERFLSLNIPVGIKKIPVVFVLFELPRFYHYVDFLTRRFGKRKPLQFLTEKENNELRKIAEIDSGVGHVNKSEDGGVLQSKQPQDRLIHEKKCSKEKEESRKVEDLGTSHEHIDQKLEGSLPHNEPPNPQKKLKVEEEEGIKEPDSSVNNDHVQVDDTLKDSLPPTVPSEKSVDEKEPEPNETQVNDVQKNHDILYRKLRESTPMMPMPRIVSPEQFRGALLRQKKCHVPTKPSIPLGYSAWDGRCKVILKVEVEPDESVLTPFQLQDTIQKINTMPSQSSENFKIKVSKSDVQVPPDADSSEGSCLVVPERALPGTTLGIDAPVSIPLPPTRSKDPNAPVYASLETIENVPTDKLLVATNTHGFDLETLKREMRLPDTKIVQNVGEIEMLHTPSHVFYRIVKSCSDEIILISKRSDLTAEDLKNCEVFLPYGPKRCDHFPHGLCPDLFHGDKDYMYDIPLKGPDGEFAIAPLMFATDVYRQPIPILPFMCCSFDKDKMKKSTEIVANFFGILVGEGVPDVYRDVFEKYLKIGMVLARRAELFEEIEYFGAIRNAEQRGFYIMITINLPQLLDEADYESRLLGKGLAFIFLMILLLITGEPILSRRPSNKKTGMIIMIIIMQKHIVY